MLDETLLMMVYINVIIFLKEHCVKETSKLDNVSIILKLIHKITIKFLLAIIGFICWGYSNN